MDSEEKIKLLKRELELLERIRDLEQEIRNLRSMPIVIPYNPIPYIPYPWYGWTTCETKVNLLDDNISLT